MVRRVSHQASIEIRHEQNGKWTPDTGHGYSLYGSGQGAGGRRQTKEEHEEQERWAKEAKRHLSKKNTAILLENTKYN